MSFLVCARRLFLRVVYPFNVLIGWIHVPRVRFEVSELEYDEKRTLLRPGMVLTSYIHGHLTNLFIPGAVKHAAVLCENEIVVEAVGTGVRIDTLQNFCTSKDLVVALQPTFLSESEMLEASRIAFAVAKRPLKYRRYDYAFDDGDSAFYCAELAVYVYSKVMRGDNRSLSFVNRTVLGVKTTLPVDFLRSIRKGKMKRIAVLGDARHVEKELKPARL